MALMGVHQYGGHEHQWCKQNDAQTSRDHVEGPLKRSLREREWRALELRGPDRTHLKHGGTEKTGDVLIW